MKVGFDTEFIERVEYIYVLCEHDILFNENITFQKNKECLNRTPKQNLPIFQTACRRDFSRVRDDVVFILPLLLISPFLSHQEVP
jgi:hypothetical protein